MDIKEAIRSEAQIQTSVKNLRYTGGRYAGLVQKRREGGYDGADRHEKETSGVGHSANHPGGLFIEKGELLEA